MHIVEVLHFGGRTALLKDLVSQSANDYEHIIVTLKCWRGPRASEFSALGVKVIPLGRTLNDKISSIAETARQCPDLVVTWSGGAHFWSILPWVFGIRVIWTIHNLVEDWGKRKSAWDNLAVKLLSYVSSIVPSKIICASKATLKVYRDVHGFDARKILAIEHGVDLSSFQPNEILRRELREHLGIEATTTVLVAVGRFASGQPNPDVKNLRSVIEITRAIREREGNTHLLMFGTNVHWENTVLVGWIEDAGLRESTSLLGSRSDVHRIFAASDIFVSTSLSEAGPIALLEAMACGVVPACTATGIIRDAVGQTGVVVEAGDYQGLLEGVQRLFRMEPKELRSLRASVRDRAVGTFDIHETISRYESVFSTVLSKTA